MTRQPNEYWLKYMILFSGSTLEQIVSTATLYQMRPPTLAYLRELRTELDQSKPPRFSGVNPTSRAWIRRQRIWSLATSDPDATAARDLLSDNKVRPVLEALLLADASIPDVARYITAITNRNLKPAVIDKYRHYFWNRNLLSDAEWRVFLDPLPDRYVMLSYYGRGLEFVLWKFGHRIALSKQDILQAVLHESAMRFIETGSMPNTMNTSIAAKNWADTVFKAIDQLDKTGDSVKEVVEELRAVAIKLGRRDISSIEQVKRLSQTKVGTDE